MYVTLREGEPFEELRRLKIQKAARNRKKARGRGRGE